MVKFTKGTPKEGVPVTLFSNGNKFANGKIFQNPGKSVVYFGIGFTKGFLGQIAKILNKKYILYIQVQNQTETDDESNICILGETTIITFKDALAKFNGSILVKVNGDVFTLPYMSEKAVEDFITKVFELTTPDSNTPEKEEYAKYNTIPVCDKVKAVVPVVKTSVTNVVAKSVAGGAGASSSKGWVSVKKQPTLSVEVKASLDTYAAEITAKAKNLAENKSKLAELVEQVAELQKQIEYGEIALTKANKILEKKRELALAEAE